LSDSTLYVFIAIEETIRVVKGLDVEQHVTM